MVNLTIDGKNIEVKEGTTVLNAARQSGIEIPTLCDHPELTPYGGCRLCLVEVEGARTLQPSCTLPVSNNMVVKTDSEKIRDARKFVLTMIFSERNHFCPYCQVSGGDCELQNAAYDEGMTHWPIQPNWKPYPVDASHPYIVLEHNRCILCRRCVRACGELVGNFTLGFEERGAESTLVADLGIPLGESTCISCGTCVQVCPTGALIDRWSAYLGKETEVDVTPSICQGCSIGCNINVLTRDNRLVRIEGGWVGSVNGGVICDVGRFHPMVEDRDRILTPMARKDGSLKAATWEDAFTGISDLLGKNNRKTVSVVSTHLSLEAMDAFHQVCDQLGINTIASTEEGLYTKDALDLLGNKGKPFEASFDAIKDADCFLVVGEDLTKDHQVASFFIKRGLPVGNTLIQISEGETGFDQFANFTLKVPENQTADFIFALETILKSGSEKEIEEAAKNFKQDLHLLSEAINRIQSAAKFAVVFGNRYPISDRNKVFNAAVSLSEQAKGMFISTKGNINSLACAKMGMDNEVNLQSAEVVILALGDEKLSQQFMKKFEKVSHLVVLASYCSPLSAAAEFVLPVANWLEQGGHFINFSGEVLESRPALKADENVLSNHDAILKMAEKLNVPIQSNWKDIVKTKSLVA